MYGEEFHFENNLINQFLVLSVT